MATLERAVALEQGHDGAVRVGEDLHLDVAAVLHVALDEHLAVAERSERLARRAGQRIVQFGGVAHDAHAATAAAERGLDERRQSDLLHRVLGAVGQHGHTGGTHQTLGLGLRSHRLDGGGRRADPDQPGVGDRAREVGAFGEEPVAGVDPVATAIERRGDEQIDAQVRLGGSQTREPHRVVGLAHEGCVAVGVAEDGDGLDPDAPARADDPPGDLATVGDEDAGQFVHMRNTP